MKEELEGVRTARNGMSRRTFLKTGVKWGTGLFGLLAFGTGYTRFLEPRWLEIVRTRLQLQHLPAAFRGMTIVHFSDLHFGYYFGISQLRELVECIAAEKPDMICFTGDLVDVAVGTNGPRIAEALRPLEAPLGKFAVLGNHDYFYKPQEVADVLVDGGFRCLRNESVLVGNGVERLRITGVEDSSRERNTIQKALQASGAEEACVLLTHTPDFAMKALPHHIQLQLSGHSHGGQIRIPFYGPAAKVPGAKLYPDGLVRPDGGKLQLYTNRGIGMTGLPFRFMCRPELTVHTLV